MFDVPCEKSASVNPRLIFLDIDGVLNSQQWMMRQPKTCNFLREVDRDAVALLTELVQRTGANIVVSSSWRIIHSLSNIRGVLHTAGFPHPVPIIAKTPRLPSRDHEGRRLYRGDEIQAWLDAYKEPIESFVILDDDSDMAHLAPRLVQTSNLWGLEREHVERAVALLGEK